MSDTAEQHQQEELPERNQGMEISDAQQDPEPTFAVPATKPRKGRPRTSSLALVSDSETTRVRSAKRTATSKPYVDVDEVFFFKKTRGT